MRAIALATAAAVIFAATNTALAWDDPNGRITFDSPSSWVMEVLVPEPQTIVLAGNANDECYFVATPNANTASATADMARRATDPLTRDSWIAAANSITPMFPGGSAQLTTQSVDNSGFWPIQRAQFSGGERPVAAAITSRPGMDLMGFCWTYGSADVAIAYDSVFSSMAHPNDAAWQSSAQNAAAERAAAEAAASAAEETETD